MLHNERDGYFPRPKGREKDTKKEKDVPPPKKGGAKGEDTEGQVSYGQ